MKPRISPFHQGGYCYESVEVGVKMRNHTNNDIFYSQLNEKGIGVKIVTSPYPSRQIIELMQKILQLDKPLSHLGVLVHS